jgi:FkbM family methyltransferase
MNVLQKLRTKVPTAVKVTVKRMSLYRALPPYVKIILAANETQKWSQQDARMAAFYSSFLRSGDLVFDIGANVGNRTKVFVHLGCNIIAVEPQTFCVAVLKRAFGHCITIVNCAISDASGSAEFYLGEAHVLSSMSKDWIRRTTESGRFAGHQWGKTITVQTTTLDAICKKYGHPAFIKIDVEGHEESVVRGLSIPIRLLSLEFTAEHIEPTLSCLVHLDQIGAYCYNYSMGESMELELTRWVSLSDIQVHLLHLNGLAWGDVYAKLN